MKVENTLGNIQIQGQEQIQNNIKKHGDINLCPELTFSSSGLNSYLTRCYRQLSYDHPTPIQYYSIKAYLQYPNNCILAQSKSGTGKTLSYLSIALLHILKQPESLDCQILIILPTRELALQVFQIYKQISGAVLKVKHLNEQQQKVRHRLKVTSAMLAIGGIPFEDDKRNFLQYGGNLIIGTIGRVMELMQKRVIDSKQISLLILDEADKLIQAKQKKFLETVEKLMLQTQKDKYCTQFLLYSATFNQRILNFISNQRTCTYLQTLAVKDNLTINLTLNKHQFILQKNECENISDALINLQNIKKFKIIIDLKGNSIFNAKINSLVQILNQLQYQRVLIFVQKKQLLQQINQRLIQKSFQPLLIHGSLSQSARIKVMNQANNSKIIVSSDLLARGIDLQLDLVILFDAKRNDTFWHRIGRTGRFGKTGVVISLDNIQDWEIYDIQTVQLQLNLIQNSVIKKQWYGQYMTQMGVWREANDRDKHIQQQYKYFDQKHSQIMEEQEHKKHSSFNLEEFKSEQKVKQFALMIKKQQIQKLTGYQFILKSYFH